MAARRETGVVDGGSIEGRATLASGVVKMAVVSGGVWRRGEGLRVMTWVGVSCEESNAGGVLLAAGWWGVGDGIPCCFSFFLHFALLF